MNASNQYISFARKYRPKDFTDLIGQEILIKTISYAISHNRLGQGYLLTGIRGVGKTTSARIIAKTINCSQLLEQDNSVKACEKCQNCHQFSQQSHPDIIEIDAASRTSVDDIREIIESSEYRPLLGKYKVFIVDEVHMLSKSAFNALLKVLEEPPPHVIFIFATTEIQKVPLTIISRCQRYDLRRLNIDELVLLLKKIASAENIMFVDQALKIIAHKADGSARDATSLFDQANSYCLNLNQQTIDVDSLNKMLSLVGTNVIIEFIDFICDTRTNQVIELLNKLYEQSVNLENFTREVSDFIAYLSKRKLIIDHIDSLYQPFENEILAILEKVDLPYLTILWQIFSKGTATIKSSHNQLIAIEMLVIKAIHAQFINNSILPRVKEHKDIVIEEKAPKQVSIIEKIAIEKEVTVDNNSSENIIDKEKQSDESELASFLQYLNQHREVEIYYFLFNEAEIKNFSKQKAILELACLNFTSQIQEQLASLLFAWTGQKWRVNISRCREVSNLRSQLIQKAEDSRELNLIKKSFPSAELADVLLAQKTNDN